MCWLCFSAVAAHTQKQTKTQQRETKWGGESSIKHFSFNVINDFVLFMSIVYLSFDRKAYSRDDTSTWLSILFGGISMLSKETGITVFLVNLTYDLYRCWPSLKRTLVDVHWTPESQQCYRRLSKLLISMGILLIIRLALLQGSFPKFSQQDNPTAYHPSFYVR